LPGHIIAAVTPSAAADMAVASGMRAPLSGPPAHRAIAASLSTELIQWSLWPADFFVPAGAVNTLATRLD